MLTGWVKPGESTTSGSLRPAGSASWTAFVRVLLSVSPGTPATPSRLSASSDSFGDMYGAGRPPRRAA